MQEGQTVAERILEVLSDGQGRTARMLAIALNEPRPLINRTLYHSLKNRVQASSDFPPVWQACSTCAESLALTRMDMSTRSLTMVYIDLGNVHDCFERACHYANDVVCIMGVADANYNHWKPPQPLIPTITHLDFTLNDNGNCVEDPLPIRYERVEQYLKDGAELLLYTHILSDLAKHGSRIARIIMCSKDKSVATMKYLLEMFTKYKIINV